MLTPSNNFFVMDPIDYMFFLFQKCCTTLVYTKKIRFWHFILKFTSNFHNRFKFNLAQDFSLDKKNSYHSWFIEQFILPNMFLAKTFSIWHQISYHTTVGIWILDQRITEAIGHNWMISTINIHLKKLKDVNMCLFIHPVIIYRDSANEIELEAS